MELNLLIHAIEAITSAAQQVAGGNLTVKLAERSANDELMRALSSMVAKLGEVVQEVKSASDNVASGRPPVAKTVRSAKAVSKPNTQKVSRAGGVGQFAGASLALAEVDSGFERF